MIWRNEYNPFFIKGFEYSMSAMMGPQFDGKIHNTASIVDIEPKQIAREAFNNLPRPELFGIIGGPPCPDFCVAGKNRGVEGDHGKLTQVYVNAIIELQPTFFLFENVPGLLHTRKHRRFLVEIMNQLSQDFILALGVLNALEYGAPQNRERLFLVGFLKKWGRKNRPQHFSLESISWDNGIFPIKEECYSPLVSEGSDWFPWPVDHRYLHAKTRFPWPTQSPFGAHPEKPVGIPDELMIGPSVTNIEATSALPNGLEAFSPKSSKFNSIAEGDVSGKSFKRLHRWRYSPAAAYGHNEVHLHPTAPRRLTVREALRIQTAPDTYAFPADLPLSHKFKMIGNGVPVKLTQAIAASFATILAEQGCTTTSCIFTASDQFSSQYGFQEVAIPGEYARPGTYWSE